MQIVVADLHERWPPRRFGLTDDIAIGSDPKCAIALADPRLGPVQAKISIGSSLTIEHVSPLTSADTLVDGASIRGRGRVRIVRASVIAIADYVLRFAIPKELRQRNPM